MQIAREGISNHASARLSDLDMEMVRAIPEGGNWKDIPLRIPSRRLDQIRESFKRGEGSRSTYYGRLRRDYPSYTINTYFNRPGNGCHIHYEQDRVISQREAARLQSFPDDFIFLGPQGAICTQVGNAVPPLLAFQIAKTLGEPAMFVDLFAGAGGTGLGFKWAGWTPILANDIEPRFLETYGRNVHKVVIPGSINDKHVFAAIVDRCNAAKASGGPLWILGGPPCQGFSTAGNRRTMTDPRNQLFLDYVNLVEKVQPAGFVFENVTGLLSMDEGKVFEDVKAAFSKTMNSITGVVLSTDEYAIPQRRKRVILVGQNASRNSSWSPPSVLTGLDSRQLLLAAVQPAISVEEALSDLPPLNAGSDGSGLPYRSAPKTAYQAFMRGLITPDEYLDRIRGGQREWQ